MKRNVLFLLLLCMFALGGFPGYAQEEPAEENAETETMIPPEELISSLKFKDAEIKIVIQAIAQKAMRNGKHVNIIIAPEIEGLVTVDLRDVHWQTALEAVLKIYDYSFEWVGKDIIMVTTLEKLAEKRQKEADAAQQEPLDTTAYKLKFLDANDVKKLMEPQLTGRGRITVLETEPQHGWRARGGYGAGSDSTGGDFERAERETGAKVWSKTLIITDTKTNLQNVLVAIEEIDTMPQQVLIEARIMEVNRDKLKDIGLDMATGSTGVTGSTASTRNFGVVPLDEQPNELYKRGVLGGVRAAAAPSVFGPKSDDIRSTMPYNAGMEFIFRKFTGAQYEAVLHALEEDVETNTLSSPRIVTLDGQEAYIMVGEKRPIIKSTISSSDTSVGISKELSYYQNLGIELNVAPQICGTDFINMIIYPSVTSSSENVVATSQIGATTSDDSYPVIKVRETQTQIVMRNGETIAIGGLLKDVKSESVMKVPFLGDIPVLGLLFQRKTTDTEKIDLVIFMTVNILNPGEVLPQVYLNTADIKKEFANR